MFRKELNTEFTTVLAESERHALEIVKLNLRDRTIVGYKVFEINETIAPFNSEHDVLVNECTVSIKTSAVRKNSGFQKDIKELFEKYNLSHLTNLFD
ncbi:MAG: hypothetical protein ACRDBG_24255 [Waterburya sp.]